MTGNYSLKKSIALLLLPSRIAFTTSATTFVASFTSIPLHSMYSLNRIHLVGYQTQPVEVRTTPSGANVTDLNLVVPYTFTNAQGQQQTGKSFHTITLWSKMAEIAGQYVRPGSQVFVAGRLQTDSWEDEQSKEKRYKTKVVGLDMIMLDPKDGQLPAPAGSQLVNGCLNNAEVVGNTTKDPEVRTTTNGDQVVSFSVATNERWMDRQSNETKERTEFHNIVVWGDLANEVAQFIKKGNRVYVSGRVQTRSWETPDGQKRTTTELIAENVLLLGVQNPVTNDANMSQSAGQSVADQSAPEESFDQSAAEPASQDVTPPAPQVQYASETKVEDLPF